MKRHIAKPEHTPGTHRRTILTILTLTLTLAVWSAGTFFGVFTRLERLVTRLDAVPVSPLLWLVALLLLAAVVLYHRHGRNLRSSLDQNEEELTFLRERIRYHLSISELAPVGLLTFVKDRVRYANNEACRILDQPADKLIGADTGDIIELVHPDDRPRILQKVRSPIEDGSGRRTERLTVRTMIASGQFRWVDTYVRVIQHDGRRAVVIHLLEVTDRILSLKELKKLSAAVEQSPNLIFITDLEGRIIYVNPQFTETTGYAFEEVLGHTPELLRSDRHSAAFHEELWATVLAGKPWSGIIQNRRKNGELYWERKKISSILGERGTPMFYLSVGEDVSVEIQAQQRLVEADKMSAIGTLAAGVAHEFRNHLAGIMGNASFALGEIDAADGLDISRGALKDIIRISERSDDIAGALLTFSRARQNTFNIQDIKPVIERTIKLARREICVNSVELVCELDDVPPVRMSASEIHQVVLNLLINARDAVAPGGIITASLMADDSEVFIRISDNGRGIEERDLPRIFEPFYSTKGVWGTQHGNGRGIGLSICQNVASAHGGNLRVKSTVGVGTTFTLAIPRHTDTREPAAGESTTPRNQASPDTSSVL